MMVRWSLVVAVTACGAAHAPGKRPDEPCRCDDLSRPVVPPTDPVELARWRRTHAEIAATLHDVALQFPDRRCTESVDADVSRVLAAHAATIRDYYALDAATCYAFSRWEDPALPAVLPDITTITYGSRGCAYLSPEVNQQLGTLMITPSCTRVQ